MQQINAQDVANDRNLTNTSQDSNDQSHLSGTQTLSSQRSTTYVPSM